MRCHAKDTLKTPSSFRTTDSLKFSWVTLPENEPTQPSRVPKMLEGLSRREIDVRNPYSKPVDLVSTAQDHLTAPTTEYWPKQSVRGRSSFHKL